MQVFISTRKTMQYKNIPGYADTRQHLNNSTISPTGAFPQAFAHKPKGKERKKVATSLQRVDPQYDRLAPLVQRALLGPRAFLEPLVPLVQRELRRHVLSCTPPRARREPHTLTTPSKLSLSLHTPQPSALRFHTPSVLQLSLYTPSVPRLSPSAFCSYSHVRFFARATRSTSPLRAPRPLLSRALFLTQSSLTHNRTALCPDLFSAVLGPFR